MVVRLTPLKLARLRSGLRQYELAERVGCSVPLLSLLENGRATLTRDMAMCLAGALGVRLEELLGVAEHDRAGA